MYNKTQKEFLTIFPELSPKAASLIHNIIIFFSVTQDRAQGRPLKPVHIIGKRTQTCP